MRFIAKNTLWILFLTGMPALLQAQKYSNEFLNIGVGARAQALGNSVVAGVDDVTAGYWNPAGLAALQREDGLQFSAMHAEWFAGIGKFDYLAATMPLANQDGRLGLSLIRFGIDGIPNTLSLYEADGTVNYDNIVEFSAADYAFIGSYGQRTKAMGGNLWLGGNVKVVRRIIGSFANSWGFGLDFGAQYRKGNFAAGIMARDVTNTFNAWRVQFTEQEKQVLLATGNDLPELSSLELTRPMLQLGAGYLFQFDKVGLRPELNVFISTDGKRNTLLPGDPFSVDPALGLEADYKKLVYLRAGINQFQRSTDFDGRENIGFRPSIGVGLNISKLRVDYAYTDLGDSQNRYSHVISLVLSLAPKASKEE